MAKADVYGLLIIASDGQGGYVNQTLTLRVNTPPVASSTPWKVVASTVGQQFNLELPASFMLDAEGDELSYSLVRSNPEHLVPNWINLTNTTLFGLPLSNTHQAIMIQLKGEDGFGGEAYRLVSISIPNSPPFVNRALGTITAFADDLKTYIVPRDAIKDSDSDELTYSAFRKEGSESARLPLPSWVTHLSSINSFNLVPKSGDQGNYTFVLVATDTQGASIQTELNVTVPNRVPVLSKSYADTELGPLEGLGYKVGGHFTDADADLLRYRFAMPDWIYYDAETKTLSGMPPQTIKDYPITITADDGYGGQNRARFTIHVDPTAIELNTAQQLQLIGYGGLAVSVMFLASCFVIRRQRRVTTAELGAKEVMAKWMGDQRGGAVTSSVILVSREASIMEPIKALKLSLETISLRADKDILKRDFQAIEQAIQEYYLQERASVPETVTGMLVKNDFIDKLVSAVEMAVSDRWPLGLQRTLAGMLHYSMRLIWVYHTGQDRLLSEDLKESFLSRLNRLLDKLAPGFFTATREVSAGQVEVYHRLLSAREALLSVRDDTTWSQVVTRVLQNSLSPLGLLREARRFWRDAPEGWYLKLTILEQLVGNLTAGDYAQVSSAMSVIKNQVAKEGRWAFRYGLVLLWQKLIIASGTNEALRQQIDRFGSVHLRSEANGCCKREQLWISRHAQMLLAERSHMPMAQADVATGVMGLKRQSPRASMFASSMFASRERSVSSASASRRIGGNAATLAIARSVSRLDSRVLPLYNVENIA